MAKVDGNEPPAGPRPPRATQEGILGDDKVPEAWSESQVGWTKRSATTQWKVMHFRAADCRLQGPTAAYFPALVILQTTDVDNEVRAHCVLPRAHDSNHGGSTFSWKSNPTLPLCMCLAPVARALLCFVCLAALPSWRTAQKSRLQSAIYSEHALLHHYDVPAPREIMYGDTNGSWELAGSTDHNLPYCGSIITCPCLTR